MKENKLQSGTDPPVKKPYVTPMLEIYSSDEEWVLLGGTCYPIRELERDNPFNP